MEGKKGKGIGNGYWVYGGDKGKSGGLKGFEEKVDSKPL